MKKFTYDTVVERVEFSISLYNCDNRIDTVIMGKRVGENYRVHQDFFLSHRQKKFTKRYSKKFAKLCLGAINLKQHLLDFTNFYNLEIDADKFESIHAGIITAIHEW